MKIIYVTGVISLLILIIGCSTVPQPNLPNPLKVAPKITDDEMKIIREGNDLHDKGKFKQALQKYYQVLNDNPDNITAMYELAFTYKELGNYDSTFSYLFKSIEYKSELYPLCYDMLGTCYDEKGHPEFAVEVYKKGIEIQPFYLLYFNLAITQINIKQFKDAEENLIKALELNPHHPGSNYTLSVLYYNQNKRIPSILASLKFLLLEPNTQRSQYTRNSIYQLVFSRVQKEHGVTNVYLTGDTTNSYNSIDFSLTASIALGDFKEVLANGNEFKIMQRILKETLPHINDKNSDFMSIYFLKFFKDLYNKNFETVMSYYIFQNSDISEVHDWIFENRDKIQEFENWIRDYKY